MDPGTCVCTPGRVAVFWKQRLQEPNLDSTVPPGLALRIPWAMPVAASHLPGQDLA